MAKDRAKRAMPVWVKRGNISTKSSGGSFKTIKPKEKGYNGFMPGDTSKRAVFSTRRGDK